MYAVARKNQKLAINTTVKKGVFSLRLKQFSAALISRGREFHAVDPSYDKARSSNIELCK